MEQCWVSILDSAHLSNSKLIQRHMCSQFSMGMAKQENEGVHVENVALSVASDAKEPLIVTMKNRQTQTVMYVRNVPRAVIPKGEPYEAWINVFPPGDPQNMTFGEEPVQQDQPRIQVRVHFGEQGVGGGTPMVPSTAPALSAVVGAEVTGMDSTFGRADGGFERFSVMGTNQRESMLGSPGAYNPPARQSMGGYPASSGNLGNHLEVSETNWKAQQISDKIKRLQLQQQAQIMSTTDSEQQLQDAAKNLDDMRAQIASLEAANKAQKEELEAVTTARDEAQKAAELAEAKLEEQLVAVQELRQAKEEVDRDLSTVVADRDYYRDQLNAFADDVNVRTEKAEQAEDELQTTRARYDELSETAAAKDKELEEIRERLEEQQNVAQAAQQMLLDKAEELRAREEEKKKLDVTLTSLSDSTIKIEREKAAAAEKLQFAEQEQARLLQERDEMLANLTERFKQKSAEVDKLSATLNESMEYKTEHDRKIKKHHEQVAMLEGKLDANRDQIRQLNAQLREQQEESERKSSEVDQLTMTLTSMQSDLAGKEKDGQSKESLIAELRAELEQTRAELSQHLSAKRDADQLMEDLDGTVSALQDRQDSLDREKRELNAKVGHMEVQLDQTRKELEGKLELEREWHSTDQRSRTELADLQQQLAAKVDALGQTQSEAQDARSQVAKLEATCAELEKGVAERAERLEAAEKTRQMTHEALEQLRAEHQEVTQNLLEKATALEQLSTDKDSTEKERADVLAQVAVLSREKDLREADIQELREQLQTQATNVDQLNQTMAAQDSKWKGKQAELEEECARLEAELRTAQGEQKEAAISKSVLQQSLEDTRKEWTECQQKLSSVESSHKVDKRELDRMTGLVEELTEEVAAKEKQIVKMQGILEKGEQILETTRKSVADKQQEIEQLRSDQRSNVQELNEEKLKLSTQLQELAEKNEQLTTRLQESVSKGKRLQTQLDDANIEMRALQQQMGESASNPTVLELREKLARYEEMLEDKTRQLDRTVQGFQTDTKMISEKNELIEQYIARVERLEDDLRQARSTPNNETKELLDKQRSEITSLRQQIASYADMTQTADSRREALLEAQAIIRSQKQTEEEMLQEVERWKIKCAAFEQRLAAQVEHCELQHDTIQTLEDAKSKLETEVELLVNGLHDAEMRSNHLQEQLSQMESRLDARFPGTTQQFNETMVRLKVQQQLSNAGQQVTHLQGLVDQSDEKMQERARKLQEAHDQEVRVLQDQIEKLKLQTGQAVVPAPPQAPQESMKDVQSMPAALCGLVLPQRPLPPNHSRRKAVLVGINYPDTHAPLKGAVNDAWNLRSLLHYTLQYQEDQMRVLVDQDAKSREMPTRNSILDALDWLVSGAQAGDSLLFAFAGYGAQHARSKHTDQCESYLVPCDYGDDLPPGFFNDHLVMDSDRDAALGGEAAQKARLYGETMCPPGAEGRQYRLISLLEILDRLQRLPPTVKVTLLLDACHSVVPNVHPQHVAPPMYSPIKRGRVDYSKLRNYIARPRFLYLPTLPVRHTPKTLVTDPPRCRVYALSACQLFEYCSEMPIEGTVQGAFTWGFIKALAANQFRCNVTTTHRVIVNIMKDLKQHFKGIDQTPVAQISQTATMTDVVIE
mmetsp:Transcript_91635/g.245492  ORF Transcript_91635/g.245492 Transcript_91635/m.245492 type:complete len:1623 (-) Transcript_91635:319-5187(-)